MIPSIRGSRCCRRHFRPSIVTASRGRTSESILRTAGVTKGALYHHFPGKDALGQAVIDEVILQLTRDKWLNPLAESDSPLDTLIRIIADTPTEPADITGGCPLNNLSQEMSPLDETFRLKLVQVFEAWRESIAQTFRHAQARGTVREDIDPDEASLFVLACYEGYFSLAKNAQDPRVIQSGKKMLIRYLESMRVQPLGASTAL